MGSGHTLLVLRHAKAAGEPGVNDAERPLTGGGRRDAGSAGRWLLARGIAPDWVLCSSARRARETWEQVSMALGAAAPGRDAVSFASRVYDAGAQDLLDLVNEQPDDAANAAHGRPQPGLGATGRLAYRALGHRIPRVRAGRHPARRKLGRRGARRRGTR